MYYLYCFKYREKTESKNSKVVRTKKGRVTISSKCTVCVKEPEASKTLSCLGIKLPIVKLKSSKV